MKPEASPLKIIFRPMLSSGVVGLRYDESKRLFIRELVILIASNQPKKTQAIALFHERLHVLLLAAGAGGAHDEEWIDERAKAMAEACPDILDAIKMAVENYQRDLLETKQA